MRLAEKGFTLVEMLVTITLLAIVTLAFYQVMFSSSKGSATSRSVVRISEEARLGFNRLLRDTREGRLSCTTYTGATQCPTASAYTVTVDFNSDGSFENPNAQGDYERLTFTHDATNKNLLLNGEVLAAGVSTVSGKDLFSYTSNRLDYDWDGNGITTWQELDAAPAHGITGLGNNDGVLNSAELPLLSNVHYSMTVSQGNRATVFHSEAQLRNRR